MALVNIEKFRFYAQKVLPTVYDDSLSYYEVLTKLCEKLDEVIENDNEQNRIIMNLPTDVSQFAEMLADFEDSMQDDYTTFTDAINASMQEFENTVDGKIVTDSAPTENSAHLVTSGGVYTAIKNVTDTLIKDVQPIENSEHYITSGGVYTAIQNAVSNITVQLSEKQNVLTWDTAPTENSTKPVYSGGIYTAIGNLRTSIETALAGKQNVLTFDSAPLENSTNPVTSDGIYTALETKQDVLTFDDVPTEGSTNPVTSDGIYTAIQEAEPTITIDPAPTEDSENAVASGGVYDALNDLHDAINSDLDGKQDVLTWDMMPTQNSTKPVYSGGVWEALAQISPSVAIDAYPTEGSSHAVASGGTYSFVKNIQETLQDNIDAKQNTLTFDATPTLNSLNPVTSDGIKRAIDAGGGGGGGTIDPVPTEDSTNAVSSGGVYTALAGKQDTLTFDATPTQDSTNPVTSGGVYTAISTLNSQVVNKQNKITISRNYHTLPTGAANWTDNQYYYTYSHNTGDVTRIEIDTAQTELWAQYGVYAYSETGSYILFKCKEIPAEALRFRLLTIDTLKIDD